MELVIVAGYACNVKKVEKEDKSYHQFSVGVEQFKDGQSSTKWWGCIGYGTGTKWDIMARKGNKVVVVGKMIKDGLLSVVNISVVNWSKKEVVENTTHTDPNAVPETEDIPF
jgi:hypothetical protein